jgi:hypothetical protein
VSQVKLKVIIVALFFYLFLILFSLAPCCFAVNQDQAKSAIAQANQIIKDCYLAVAAADKAGGNVTDLLSTLQHAGMLLSKANLAFGKGDYDSAYNFAVQSKDRLERVVADANFVKEAAEHSANIDFMINVVGSSVGTVAILVGSFAVWFFLKRRYGNRQVNSNES